MYVRVRVTPGAKKERVSRQKPDEFDIAVREPAQRNLANTRVRELIAAAFGTGVGAVRIVSGHRSPTKIISVALTTSPCLCPFRKEGQSRTQDF
ncbi:hypothetical protein A3H16_03045 [Candidatus Kaiserbacteria bacterium RIFCSPLOWO2_12_FULL_53_8]|uniref:Uncharacterized protein n=1 Tax=Candidatus Kaiserbacteria bacterium RIFCSPLOWO2_12_FULL_53_8 TaxID=1798529 RepID=A0A1F6FYW8_9BACT|nr:MAG: hypothetical protein A3H16_03045 [Candidatus Kaiserbacteria bacterium RIFCSPLOWO2_12_FULL_53_8]